MKKAKKIYAELCQEIGESLMNEYTNGWKELLIYDRIKDQTINEFIISLFEPGPAYID